MRKAILFAVASVFLFTAAAQENPPAAGAPESVIVQRKDFAQEEKRQGTFVPAVFEEISIWPEEYGGELLFLEVLEHGLPVNKGDVVARFDPEGIETQIKQTERQLRSAQLSLQGAVERDALADKAAESSLTDARAELEAARRSLEGWERFELEFARRDAELRQKYGEHSIEDQNDELAQLEAMYRDDELTDATEEIVLKRSRRDLNRSRDALAIQKDKRNYETAYEEPLQTDRRRRGVKEQEEGLDRLVKNQAIEKRSRQDGIRQAEESVRDLEDKLAGLKRDRDLITVRAPRNGVLLHGSAEDYRPAKVAPRHRRGSRGSTHTALFVVADPDRFDVAFDLPEGKLQAVRTGMAAKVSAAGLPSVEAVGAVRLERFPAPGSAAGAENLYAGKIAIEKPLQGLVAGMRAEVRLVVETLRDVVVLPNPAVVGSGVDAHCWAADPSTGAYVQIALKLGPASDSEQVVYGVLSEGQKVLLCAPKK